MSIRRSAGIVFDPEDFKPIDKFPPENLPNWHEVICRILQCVQGKDTKTAINEVAKELESQWISHTVYACTIKHIKDIITKKYDAFKSIRAAYSTGKPSVKFILSQKEESRSQKDQNKVKAWQEKYAVFLASLKELCDIKTENKERIKSQESEYDVKMTAKENIYHQKQKEGDRRYKCEKTIDPKFIEETKQKVKRAKYYEKLTNDANSLFEYKNEFSDGSGDETTDRTLLSDEDYCPEAKKRNKTVTETVNISQNGLPESMRFVRESERKVSPDFYECMHSLAGEGFSVNEAMKAFVIVSNKFYKNQFKMPSNNDVTSDRCTLPARQNVSKNMELGEVKRLDMIAKKIMELKEEEKMITMAQDSTTRKQVGTYSVAGIHCGKDNVVPLPTIGVTSETAVNVADTHAAHLEILAAASGTSAKELYNAIDTHMTDSVSHNKKIAQDLAEKYEREDPAGQVFCNSHTSLGISRAINSGLNELEVEMGVENIFKSVLVEVTYEKKHGSIVAQSVYALLALIDAEHSAKTWNYHNDFVIWLKQHDIEPHFFRYRDDRFDGLAHGCALVLYLWDHYFLWLNERTDINNRLACFARSMENIPYFKIALTVFGAYGIHLIEPFNATMFSKQTTHTFLIEFYANLMKKFELNLDENFFVFNENAFDFPQQLFHGCKLKYHEDVVGSVFKEAKAHMDDCIKLANFVLPMIKNTVISQRGSEYGFCSKPSDFPVLEQAKNIDDVPQNNLHMESYCGRVAAYAEKLGTLESASRAMIFHGTESLANESLATECVSKPLSSFRDRLEIVKSVKIEWSARQKQLLENGMTKKQAQILQTESFKNKTLRILKDLGGPFTCAEEVDSFYNSDAPEAKKLQRFKNEVKYFRDTCLLFDKNNSLFRLMNTVGKNRKQKSCEEFAQNLKLLFGKTQSQESESSATISLFRDALSKRIELRILHT